jgi:hypothetical protein
VLISNAENPDNMVWNLWSRKEAAYKIYNRVTGIRGYFPEVRCILQKHLQGLRALDTFYTKTEIVG